MSSDQPGSAVPTADPSSLSLNRCLHLAPIRSNGRTIALEVNAPVRGEGVRYTRFDVATDPRLFEFLLSLRDRARPASLVIAADMLQPLADAGVLLPRAATPRAVRYACFIDAHAQRAPAAADADGTPWIVNPTLRIVSGSGSFAADWNLCPTADAHALAWLTDARTRIEYAYWLTAQDTELLRELAAGRHRLSELGANELARLARAGLLVTAGRYRSDSEAAARRGVRRRAFLKREGYVQLDAMLPAPLLASLQSYFGALIDEGHLRFADPQSRRYYRHSEPIAVWLHQQIAACIGALTGTPVKPSYAFLAGYVPGSQLRPHVDRAQCEYTLSLNIDFTLEGRSKAQRAEAWPLCLNDRHGRTVQVHLNPGDALLFKGRELTHYRAPLGPGRRSTSVFFHFVGIDFAGQLDGTP
jgi:hypothetical protein